MARPEGAPSPTSRVALPRQGDAAATVVALQGADSDGIIPVAHLSCGTADLPQVNPKKEHTMPSYMTGAQAAIAQVAAEGVQLVSGIPGVQGGAGYSPT